MRGGDDCADARLVARHGRKPDALREHAVLEQASDSFIASAASPTMTGVIGLSLRPVLKPSALQTGLEEPRVLPQPLDELRFLSSTSMAAMQAAATDGGCEVENRNGRARW